MLVRRAVSAALALLAAAPAQVTATANDTIPAILSNSPQLNGFANLISEIADFVGDISSLSDITIFAPSNAALEAAKDDPAYSSATSNRDLLAALLRYHVLYTTARSTDFSTTPRFVHTLLNDTAYSNVTGGQVVELQRRGANATITTGLRATANIIYPDIALPNGVLHIVDTVFTIPPPMPITAVRANLTSFAGALTRSGLANDVAVMKDLTVFAPNNRAFANIAGAASQFSAAQLHEALAYHIIPDSQGYSSLLTNTTDVSTLAGEADRVDIVTTPDGAIFVNAARVVFADVLIAQGVLHVIDAVLNVNATSKSAPDPANITPPILYTASSATATGDGALWFTSGQSTPTTRNSAFSTTTDRVVAGYSTSPTQNSALATSSTSSSHAGGARAVAAATGAMGMAGLYGGGAVMAAAAALMAV